MRKLLIPSIFILIFNFVAFSQTNENLLCPTVLVAGPAGIPNPDMPMTFVGSISKENERSNLKYNWTVSNGEIIEGQGTLTIKFLLKDIRESFTATLEIDGLPKECKNIASETGFIHIAFDSVQFDQFSTSSSRIDKAQLENLAAEINKQSLARAYIIEHFEKTTSPKLISRKNKAIIDYLKRIGIETDKFVLLNSLSAENQTHFFIVPAGASPPNCQGCVTVEIN